jgi:hypothetical protein
MKIGILGAFVAAIGLIACGVSFGNIKGSGNVMTQQYPLSDFTKVEAGNSFNLTITQADSFSVQVKADDNLVDHLDVRKSDDILVIRLKSGKSIRNATLEAQVSLPELTSVKLTGASKGTVRGFASGGEFSVDISGASKLSGDIQAAQTRVDLSGASSLDLTGSSDSFILRGSGASRAVMEDFAINSAEVHLSGASTATLNVRDNFGPVALSGASKLIYLGDPAFRDFHTSGASSISARE